MKFLQVKKDIFKFLQVKRTSFFNWIFKKKNIIDNLFFYVQSSSKLETLT